MLVDIAKLRQFLQSWKSFFLAIIASRLFIALLKPSLLSVFSFQDPNKHDVEESSSSENEDSEDDLVDVEDVGDAMSHYPLKKK